jgi:hypothetical protein
MAVALLTTERALIRRTVDRQDRSLVQRRQVAAARRQASNCATTSSTMETAERSGREKNCRQSIVTINEGETTVIKQHSVFTNRSISVWYGYSVTQAMQRKR